MRSQPTSQVMTTLFEEIFLAVRLYGAIGNSKKKRSSLNMKESHQEEFTLIIHLNVKRITGY